MDTHTEPTSTAPEPVPARVGCEAPSCQVGGQLAQPGQDAGTGRAAPGGS